MDGELVLSAGQRMGPEKGGSQRPGEDQLRPLLEDKTQ